MIVRTTQICDASVFDNIVQKMGLKPIGQKYDGLRICVGEEVMEKLRNSKIFLVGAGAIGCELLKNYAMIGAGVGKEGQIYITDPDVIENSNLNRQFLFREKHIRKPKSSTAAAAAVLMNRDLKNHVTPLLERISDNTEHIFTEEFFNGLSVVTNALDNVNARRYVD